MQIIIPVFFQHERKWVESFVLKYNICYRVLVGTLLSGYRSSLLFVVSTFETYYHDIENH